MGGFSIKGHPRPTPSYFMSGSNLVSVTPNAGMIYLSGEAEALGDPPRLADFNSYIDTWGPNRAAAMSDGDWYLYDGDRGFRFLADWTGDTATYTPASLSIRDAYWTYSSVNNDGPWTPRTYTDGLYLHALESGFPSGSGLGGPSTVAQAFANWADKFNYTYSDQWPSHWSHVASREMSYSLMAVLRGEQLVGWEAFEAMLGYGGNYPLSVRYPLMLSKMENHLYQWRFDDFTDPSTYEYMNPFMVGLTTYSLAQYYDWHGNDYWPTDHWATIPEALQDMLVWMYTAAPNHTLGGLLLITDYDGPGSYDCFPYADREYEMGGGSGGAGGQSPDLNNIITPCYAWLGKHFGNPTYVTDMADRLFAGHVHEFQSNPWYGNTSTRQWNQFVYRIQEYFDWRSQI